jgi:hypothetical protein
MHTRWWPIRSQATSRWKQMFYGLIPSLDNHQIAHLIAAYLFFYYNFIILYLIVVIR